jgi:hypothetical protein
MQGRDPSVLWRLHMNRVGILFAFLLVAISSFAAEHGSNSFRKGAMAGSGFAASPLGGFEASSDFVTPRLFSIDMESQNRSIAFALFAKAGIAFDPRLNLSIPISAGLRITTQAETISPYSQLGVDFVYSNTAFVSRTTSFGVVVAMGCDFIVTKGAVDTFFGAYDSSFFVEANIRIFHNDTSAGANLLNGFTPRLGYRLHF